MKLHSKIFGASLIIGTIPLILIGIIAVWQSDKALSYQTFNQLESLREIKKIQVEGYFLERKQDVNNLLEVVGMLWKNALDKMLAIQENKKSQITDYFKERVDNLVVISQNDVYVQGMIEFNRAFKIEQNTNSEAWLAVENKRAEFLRKIAKQYNFHEWLFVSPEGDVVFSAKKSMLLGKNLLKTDLQINALKNAFEKSLKSEQVIEDFSFDPVYEKHLAHFSAPFKHQGELVGVLIMSITPEKINEIMLNVEHMGKTGDNYLIGRANDGKTYYRSDRRTVVKDAFGKQRTSAQIEQAFMGETAIGVRVNMANKLALFINSPLQIYGLNWVAATTFEMEEAITPKQENNQDFFSNYINRYGYYDLLLVDPKGKVFYTTKRETDYEANLFEGTLANSHLTKLIKRTIEEKTFAMSDYALYEPTQNRPVAFIAQPLLSSKGEVQIIVVLQMLDDTLNSLTQQREGLGKTGEVYLVGNDYLMRSNSVLDPKKHSIEYSFKHPEDGQAKTPVVEMALKGEKGKMITTNYAGNTVLSAYTPIKIENHQWALIADIGKDEAFAAVLELKLLTAMIGIFVIFGIWFLARKFTQQLVTPLSAINNQLRILSQGKPTQELLQYHGKDEIAEIVCSTEQLKTGIRGTIEQAKAIANGNFNNDVKLLSDQDEMGQALTEMTRTLRGVILQANAIAAGDYNRDVKLLSESDELGRALLEMTRRLRDITNNNRQALEQLEQENARKNAQDWLKTGQTQLSETMSGDLDLPTLCKNIVTFLARYLECQVATFYILHTPDLNKTQPHLKLIATYAYKKRKNVNNEISIGEGLLGQAALEKEIIVVTQVPEDYVIVQSGLGERTPHNLVIVPFLYENNLKGVFELGAFKPFSEMQLDFLQQVTPAIAIAVNTAESRVRLQELLQQSQTMAEELQSQTEELQAQQEELRQTNEELEERSRELERQKESIRIKNQELEKNRVEVERKAKELEVANQYKSEFLANMSHELRTPLNSMLILAQMLATNKDSNLTDKQVEFAQTIHKAGTELLVLINDILDLSKVEAGHLELHFEECSLLQITESLNRKFSHMAEDKGLNFVIDVEKSLEETLIYTDAQRLQQVITNLISNAFKFTEKKGRVTLNIRRPDSNIYHLSAQSSIMISVIDSGIGIPKAKQHLIFEAFRQADGTTSRRYGGTGLGLSISRELTRLLGGVLNIESEEGVGSTFSLTIPERLEKTATSSHQNNEESHIKPILKSPANPSKILMDETPPVEISPTISEPPKFESKTSADDRDNIQTGDRVLLIIEDDVQFSQLIQDLAHEKDFKCILAHDGKMGLELAKQYQPNAIILDIGLPLVDGWTVMDRLKTNAQTRHIPVHFMSGGDIAQSRDARQMGAIGYLLKPVSMTELSNAFKKIEYFIDHEVKHLLIALAEQNRRQQVLELLGGGEVSTVLVNNSEEAYQKLHSTTVDCIVLDIDFDEGRGLKMLEQLRSDEDLSLIPVIIYTNRELTSIEEQRLAQNGEDLTLKAVHSPERLLDEATLFLHQVESKLPKEQQRILKMIHDKEAILNNKKVLLVDDDARNVFSLGATLEEKGMEVLIAKDGTQAIQLLEENPNTDLILMDIMMPRMDGYETMRKIRSQARFRKLPIIALTAKAMKGDRVKCIEAGANDYMAKPLETEKLLSLMRVWLYR
jgi:signal transduction histidine kinase/DNA-binding response OmpR family regulator